MRMWMIDPKFLCRKHLLGEHGELHKFLPSFRKGHKVTKRFAPVVQLQFNGYVERHDALAAEMLRRGMNHKSPLVDVPDFAATYPDYFNLTVDIDHNLKDLCERCAACRERIENATRLHHTKFKNLKAA